MPLDFVDPRESCPVDLEAHLALLPPGATCKGMFVRDVLAMARKHATPEQIARNVGVEPRRYLAFRDYPMTENMRLTYEVGRLLGGARGVGVGLRALGRIGFRSFLSSTPARVLMAVVGVGEVDKVFMLTPKSYALSVNYGRVTAERIGERCVHISITGYPSYLETYQVGIFEGVYDHFHINGRARIALQDLATATIELTW